MNTYEKELNLNQMAQITGGVNNNPNPDKMDPGIDGIINGPNYDAVAPAIADWLDGVPMFGSVASTVVVTDVT